MTPAEAELKATKCLLLVQLTDPQTDRDALEAKALELMDLEPGQLHWRLFAAMTRRAQEQYPGTTPVKVEVAVNRETVELPNPVVEN